jgi:hypothetical protein
MSNIKILVNTPPRTGTHLLTRSIGNTLNIPYFIDKRFDRIKNQEDLYKEISNNHENKNLSSHVVGSHFRKSNEVSKLFNDYLHITTTRHPLGQAVSILKHINIRALQVKNEYKKNNSFLSDVEAESMALRHLKWCPEVEGDEINLLGSLPNSDSFVSYVISERFIGMRNITLDYKSGNNVIDFDKIVTKDPDEIEKINDILKTKIFIEKRELDNIYTANTNYWKEIISQETADKIAPYYPGYDFQTNKRSSYYGNKMFMMHSKDIIDNNFLM